MKGISTNKKILGGEPCIEHTRIPVSLIEKCLEDGITVTEICADYYLTIEQVNDAINYINNEGGTQYKPMTLEEKLNGWTI